MTIGQNDFLDMVDAPRWGRAQSVRRSDLIRLIAAVPIAGAAFWTGGLDQIFVFATTLAAVLGTQAAFCMARRQRMETGGALIATSIVVLVPADIPGLHLVLAAIFGVALGELIFGGRGFSFVQPAIASLAFVHFSVSSAAAPYVEIGLTWAALGGIVLLAAGLAEWRVVVSALGVLALAAFAGGAEGLAPTGAAVFIVVFLVADPAIVPLTRGARLTVGVMFALLATALQTTGAIPGSRELIFAAFLTSVFAPLCDSAVLALHDVINRFRRRG